MSYYDAVPNDPELELWRDHSAEFKYEVNPRTKLFDFQEAGAARALETLKRNSSFVLAFGAGLGKTITTATIILQYLRWKKRRDRETRAAAAGRSRGEGEDDDVPSSCVLYVAPGGLVGQIEAALSVTPWRKPTGLAVERAETGAELAAALGRREEFDVLVSNKALKCYHSECLEKFCLIVVDEAHQVSYASSGLLRDKLVLALTATPLGHGQLLRAVNVHFNIGSSSSGNCLRDSQRRLFRLEKTEAVMKLVGTATTILRTATVPLPGGAQEYYEDIVEYVARHCTSPLSRLVLLLEVAKLERRALERRRPAGACGGSPSAPAETAVASSPCGVVTPARLRACLESAVGVVGSVVIRYTTRYHCGTAARVLGTRRVASRLGAFYTAAGLPLPVLSLEDHRNALAESARHEAAHGVNECACCGLTAHEIELLHRAHCASTPDPSLLLPGGASKKPRFASALVRYPDAASAQERARRLSLASPSDRVLLLTSQLSAGQRSNVIKKFTSFGGLRAKLCVFKRGVLRSRHPLVARVFAGDFGDEFLLRVSELLVSKRLLVADATVDVGFDLHRHLDTVLVPRMVSTRTQFLQLVGRCSRIAVEREDQGAISLSVNVVEDTLDALFEAHVQSGGHVPNPRGAAHQNAMLTETIVSEISERLEPDPVLQEWFSDQLFKRMRLS
jgi:hypothetical protein